MASVASVPSIAWKAVASVRAMKGKHALICWLGLNMVTLAIAFMASIGAWHFLPLPAPPLAQLFITTAWGGGMFLSGLAFFKATQPDEPEE